MTTSSAAPRTATEPVTVRVVPARAVPTPQQERAVEAPRLVVSLTGPFDEVRLRAAVESVFARYEPLHMTHQGEAYDLDVAIVERGDPARVTFRAPAGSVDAEGLFRVWRAIAHAYAVPDDATRAVGGAQLAEYFNGLFDDHDATAGTQYWAFADGERSVTPKLMAALAVSTATTGHPRVRRRLLGVAPTPADAVLPACPLEAVLLAAWRVVLRRVEPEEDGFIGVYRRGPAADLPDAIGLLGRYVPFPLAGDATAPSVARQLADMDPLADFFRWRDAEAAPGFRIGFRFLDTSPLAPLGSARADLVDIDVAHEPLVLELQATRVGADLDVAVAYDPDRVEVRVVEAVAHWVSQAIELTTQEEDAVVLSWPPTRLAGRRRRVELPDVLTSVENHARATPDAPAVSSGTLTWTYAELHATVEAVAGRMAALGVSPGEGIAVCMERVPLLLAALLAATHRGAFFVPLDPSHPSRRLAAVVADAALRVVVVDAASRHRAPEGTTVLCLDDPPLVSITCPPRVELGREAPAYVIYTSGSTGQPKGVRVGHAALANYLAWACEEYRVGVGTGSLVHSSIAVDLTVTSLFAPLVAGRTVGTVASDDPEALADRLGAARGLSFLKLTPTLLALLGRLLAPGDLRAAANHFVLGGEQLTGSVLAALGEPDGTTMVTNEYGPTETTVGSCAFTFRLGDTVPDPVPIGTPIWNTDVELVDSSGRPQPPGLVGELLIAGDGVAHGYLHRPDLTAATFAERERDGARERTYRTGDRARQRADGLVEYLGRSDEQTKIHGFRVETAEVADVLARAAGVLDVAVVAVPAEHGGGAFLSAFVVASARADQGARGLSAWMAERLPPYACPDRVEIVDRLPLAAGGKLDRAALVALSRLPLPAASALTPEPQDVRVTILRDVWRTVLGGREPGVLDNFFASGGDSITAMHLVAGARRGGLRLSVRDVLVHRTVERIAAAARPLGTEVSRPGRSAVGPVPLSPNQRDYLAAGAVRPAAWALRWRFAAPVRVAPDRLEKALRAVRSRHPALRTRVALDGGAWSAAILADPSGPPPRTVDVRGTESEERAVLVEAELSAAEAQLDLSEGPLVQLCLFDPGADHPQQLAWVASHFVVDVVSLQVMTASLWEAYETGRAEEGDDGYVDWLRAVAATHAAPAVPRGAVVRERHTSCGRSAARLVLDATATTRRGGLAVIATSVMCALDDVLDEGTPPVCVELHGRDYGGIDVELASAVGWFTGFATIPQSTGDAVLDAVARARPGPRPPNPDLVAVNYLGDLGPGGGALGTQRFTAQNVDAPALTLFGLEVVCWIEDADLHFSYRYDTCVFAAEAIDLLSAAVPEHMAQVAAAVRRVALDGPADMSPKDAARIVDEFA
jgi:amino acid adenylation domain-containing protein